MKKISTTGLLCASIAGGGREARGAEQTPQAPPPPADGESSPTLPAVADMSEATTNSAIALPAVTVSADLDRARDQIAPGLGAVTYTIGPNQIQSMPQGENTPFSQVLLRAPGVVADSFGEVHVRGEHGDLTYRLNGVLLPEGLNGFGQEIDTRLINSVTLITGTLPSQFGFRTAGIVDVSTKTGSQLNGGEVSLYGGSYDTINPSVQLGGASGKVEYFATASYLRNDIGIENPISSYYPIHDTTAQEKLFLYLSYKIDDTSRLNLLLNGSYADFQLPNTPGLEQKYELAGAPSADSANVDENQNEQNYYAVLSYQKTAGELSFQASSYTRYGQIRFSPDPVGDLIFQGVAGDVQNSFFANGLQFDAERALGDQHTARAGALADYTDEKLDTSTLVFSVDANGMQASPQPISIADQVFNHGLTAGVYLQDEWRLTERLTLNYGARYDRFEASFDHEGQLSPRANFVWQITGKTSAHFGYARYFTPPSTQYVPLSTIEKFRGTSNAPFNEQDNPTQCERSHYFDVGLSRQLTPAWQTTVDAFYKDAKDLIDLGQFGNAVILSPFSYREGSVYGSELSTTYKQGPFSAFANFSYVVTSARDINSAQFEFPQAELDYIQTHDIQLDHEGRYTASAGASYVWEKNTRFYVDALYGYGLRGGFANSEKLPDYYPVSLGIEHAFHTKWGAIRTVKLRFDCSNVFDEVYRLRDGTGLGISASQYGRRRTFLVGLSAIF